MEQSNADLFLSVNSNKFPQDRIVLVKDLLLQASPEKDMVINTTQFNDPVVFRQPGHRPFLTRPDRFRHSQTDNFRRVGPLDYNRLVHHNGQD